ncbi:alpha,alpha-trehalase [Muriicola jejuensis]|uniref:Trehalase n=1 Tax=Muriicola jejuensis TaxID=504488 RepID=A0A6P0U9I0_9FLAO|nr:trehalase family glycosidase [Muriicola jejuensis]NER09687.1 trehalase [Muriicola jejuensis]SMP06613.1 alpha,alpha-trehalase [Muriicola jejuensis]
MKRFFSITLVFILLLTACREEVKSVSVTDFYATDLFKDVQLAAIYKDSKTFVDLVPDRPYGELVELYRQEKSKPGFELGEFVKAHFSDPFVSAQAIVTDTTKNMYEHISSMWGKLTRGPDVGHAYSSRIPLPHKYVVPGGRFREIYYWDSYFTIEGLMVDEQEDLARSMVDNFSFLIDSIGFIPNGTRAYYLTRSQPPFFALMVDAISREDKELFSDYFPSILKEYNFWMEGKKEIKGPNSASKYAVRLDQESFLNRYWDSGIAPRPEAYKEDHHLAAGLSTEADKRSLYTHLRSGAASGWDFSSRWYLTEGNFGSTKTADILPVDLNCLMYFMEKSIARGYALAGDSENETLFLNRAEERKSAIQTLFWNPGENYFFDYNYVQKSFGRTPTLAGAFPLFFELATPEQAESVKDRLMSDFLKDGGLVTTLEHSGQQWDAPNGWAPLQYIAVEGLLNYGYVDEARTIMERWLALNERVYKDTGKMMEKYNVEDISLLSGGGEYETQDGFGWTNGVALVFRSLLDAMDPGE